MTEEDIKYFYAAYKKKEHDNKTPLEFKNELLSYINHSYDDAYVLLANVKDKLEVIGSFFAQYAGPLMVVGDVSWFPWASKRNRIESMVNAINELRKERLMIFISNLKEKRFYEYICKHGILKRIGTLDDLYKDEPAAMFQSRIRK